MDRNEDLDTDLAESNHRRTEELADRQAGRDTGPSRVDRLADRLRGRPTNTVDDEQARRVREERLAEEARRRNDQVRADPVRDDRAGDDRHPLSDDDIQVITGGEDFGVYRARRRFGGFDVGAALAGLLAALGMTVLLGGIAGAIGTIGYQLDVQRDTDALSAGGFVAGMVVLVLSFLVGGWVAGRVGRYDGGKNGLGAAIAFVVLSAVLAALGAALGDQYDVFANVALPQWFTSSANTATAVLSAVIAVVVMLASGWFGGRIGARYHRKADAYLIEYAGADAAAVTGAAALARSTDRTGRRTLLPH